MFKQSINKLFTQNSITKRTIFNFKDPFLLENQLTDDEKLIKNLTYNFSKDVRLQIS
jgi:hypothetical protein